MSNRRSRRPRQTRTLRIETLERRELMTSASLLNGSLSILGTNAAETILVRQANDRITISGVPGSFSANSVQRITVDARGGNDTVDLKSGFVAGQQFLLKPASILGGAGNDLLIGGHGSDYIDGGRGRNTIYGGAGNDQLYGSDEAGPGDFLYGDAGDDLLMGYAGHDHCEGGDGNDRLRDFGGNDELLGGAGDDFLYGDTDHDYLDGGEGNDTLYGVSGNDTLYGGGGNDMIYGGIENDTLYGGPGDDVLDAGPGDNWVYGGSGDDLLDGSDGRDFLYGEAGNDTIRGHGHTDHLYGGEGNDRLLGRDGNDALEGGPGNDTLLGGADHDYLDGEAGNDDIHGETGNDRIFGGLGSDTLAGGLGDDIYHFSASTQGVENDSVSELPNQGTDTLDFSWLSTSVNVDLRFGASAIATHLNRIVTVAVFGQSAQLENVQGGAAGDTIIGNDAGNRLQGNGGNDALRGEWGNDTLSGGHDDDQLFGGYGNDRLFGEAGVDRVFGEQDHDWLEAGSIHEFADGGDGFDWNAHRWDVNGANMDDVSQLGSGTCWFLASLAAVAKNSDLAARISYQGNFVYRVNMFESSSLKFAPQFVHFDGTLYNADARPATEGESWVLLFNRAAIQALGIEWTNAAASRQARGSAEQGLRMLTGQVTTTRTLSGGASSTSGSASSRQLSIPNVRFEDLTTVLRDALANRRAIVAATPVSSQQFVGDHCYTVVAVDMNGNVTLRNPWGRDGGKIVDTNPLDGYVVVSAYQFRNAFANVTIG